MSIDLPSPPSILQPHKPRQDSRLSYRTSYDWTIYSPDQLRLMESYWDEAVRLYDSLLPPRIRTDREARYGINLGTFNGGFQKAWMRTGYRMFGVEYVDVIDELHAYGCEGRRGDFHVLEGVPDATFDFAIMDRAMFNKPESGFRLDTEEGRWKAIDGVTTFIQKEPVKVPPYLGAALRVMKPDGVFLGILYPYWSETIVREAYAAGKVNLWAVERTRPYLVLRIDRAGPVSPFPEVRDSVARLRGVDAAAARDAASSDPLVGRVTVSGSKIKFHHLPTNHLVEFDTDADEIVMDDISLNDPSEATFFEGQGRLVLYGPPSEDAVALLVDPFILGRVRAGNPVVDLLSQHRRLYVQLQMGRGARAAAANFELVLDALSHHKQRHLVLGTFGSDAQLNPRSGLPRIRPDDAISIYSSIIRRGREHGCEPVIVVPPRLAPPSGSSGIAAKQAVLLEKYRDATIAYAHEEAVRMTGDIDPVEIAAEETFAQTLERLEVADAIAHSLSAVLSQQR